MTESEMLEAEKYWCENCCNWDKEEVQMDACSTCKLTGTRVFAQESGKECKCFNVPAENVFVFPYKVGQTVYLEKGDIKIGNILLGEELIFECYFDCDWYIENVGCEDCPFADWEQSYEGEWDCRAGGYFSFTEKDIGKTVFLTREEAEQALKGGVDSGK